MWARVSERWNKAELGAQEQGLTLWIFLRCLGLIHLMAFWSLGTQVLGLVGKNGLLPASEYLARVAANAGGRAYWEVPTLCWFDCSDVALLCLCVFGAISAAALVAGVLPRLCLFCCYVAYLSLASVCQDFLWFQWDSLLLEASFLALFVAPMCLRHTLGSLRPPPFVGLYLLRWLIFRLMLASAAVKLTSGDPTWRNLTALSFHYETQPLPSWAAWYAHLMPLGFHQASALAMFVIEGPCAFLVFAPRRLRMTAALAFIFLQLLILATGSYGFFNLLTIVLTLPLFDDRVWPKWLKQRAKHEPGSVGLRLFRNARWAENVRVGARPSSLLVGLILVWLSLAPLSGAFNWRADWLGPAATTVQKLAPFRLVNMYGLFAVMTTERPEILIEGSSDGTHFEAYDFRFKPDSVFERPVFSTPHMPRLDWQLWFAALQSLPDAPWVSTLCQRLLEGSPQVLSLLGHNPFPNTPPRFVQATLYRYRFTDWNERRATGAWWKREKIGPYSPIYFKGGYGWAP